MEDRYLIMVISGLFILGIIVTIFTSNYPIQIKPTEQEFNVLWSCVGSVSGVC